jgi:hypothetical protein
MSKIFFYFFLYPFVFIFLNSLYSFLSPSYLLTPPDTARSQARGKAAWSSVPMDAHAPLRQHRLFACPNLTGAAGSSPALSSSHRLVCLSLRRAAVSSGCAADARLGLSFAPAVVFAPRASCFWPQHLLAPICTRDGRPTGAP